MASLEFPDRSNNINNNTSTNTNTASNDKENQKRHEQLLKAINTAKEQISKGLGIIGQKTEEVADDFTEQVFGSGLLVRTLKDNTFNLVKNIKNGLVNSVTSLYDLFKLNGDERNKKIKGYFKNIKSFMLAPFKLIIKFLKGINKGITWISEKTISGIGKTLKYLLIGAGIFFKWLKNWLMKSILFKALGKIGGLAWEGIKGVINIGGNLASSIAGLLVGSGAKSIFKSGIKSLVTGLSGKTLMSMIVKALPAIAAGALGWKIFDEANNPERFENRYEEAQRVQNLTDEDRIKSGLTEEQWEEGKRRELQRAQEYRERNLISSAQVQQYNEWIKQYPEIMKKTVPDSMWTRDRDNDGIADYTESRYNKAKQEILKVAPESEIIEQFNRIKQTEELKNKSILKNTAGVSST